MMHGFLMRGGYGGGSSCVSGTSLQSIQSGPIIRFGSLIDLTRLSRTPTARKATDDARLMLKIQNLIEDLKCFETVRSRRWPDGVTCPPLGLLPGDHTGTR